MPHTNIIYSVLNLLNERNLLSLEESADLRRLAEKFDKNNFTLPEKEEAKVWKFINRLEANCK